LGSRDRHRESPEGKPIPQVIPIDRSTSSFLLLPQAPVIALFNDLIRVGRTSATLTAANCASVANAVAAVAAALLISFSAMIGLGALI
jgi:hypothetical protein